AGDAAGEAGRGVRHPEPVAVAQTIVEVTEQRLETLVLAPGGRLVAGRLFQAAREPVDVLAGLDGIAEPALDRLPASVHVGWPAHECARHLPELSDQLDVPEDAGAGGVVGVPGAEGLEVAARAAIGQVHQ